MSTEQVDRLERDLRAAARSFDEVPVSGDAWQENQRRLRSSAQRSRRVLPAAAAGIVGVLAVGALAFLAQSGGGAGMPAGGTADDPWATQNILGEIVDAETLTVDGTRTVHQIVLTDTTGDGPDLCDRYLSEGASAGGCSHRDPRADDPATAFDWLSGTEGGVKGVLAGVDERVTTVRVWMDNGDMVPAQLHPTGWEDTRMFALTVAAGTPAPQRLVGYGRDGNVLEAVDLGDRFGQRWLAPRRVACGGESVATWRDPGASDVSVGIGSSDAVVSIGGSQTCLDRLRPSAIAGWHVSGERIVLVVGPEVAVVRVVARNGHFDELEATPVQGSPWRIVSLDRLGTTKLTDAVAYARDENGTELGRQVLEQPTSA